MNRRKTFVVVVMLLCVAAFTGYWQWRQGTPYQGAFRSPNGEYSIQRYVNWTPAWGTMPGQGSDAIGGYIRLYDRNGKLLHERWESFHRDVEPVWAGDKVYLKGVAEMDSNPWVLPTPSQ